LKEEDSAREFQLASAFFVNGEDELKQTYKEDAKKAFVDIYNVNFNDRNKLQSGYDRWLKTATNGVLQSDQLTIDPNAKMILASAMYFKGDWLFTFPTVQPGKFIKSSGREINVPMMSINFKKYHYGYLSNDNGEWLSIPYNSTEAMLILLPSKKINLDTMITNTPSSDITDIIDIISKSNKPHTLVNITMPTFKIDSSINLKEPLEKMGIKRIFSQQSEFYPFENSKIPLRASAATQQSVLEVNESGSVGASVSKFSIVALSVQSPIKQVVFTVDRPFLAVIVNRLYRIPYFIAKVSDPTQT